jgi:hypothetical protein
MKNSMEKELMKQVLDKKNMENGKKGKRIRWIGRDDRIEIKK